MLFRSLGYGVIQPLIYDETVDTAIPEKTTLALAFVMVMNAEGYVTEQSHGGADISSERRSIFLYDKVKDDEIEITVFSRYVDKNTYLKVQYLPHTKYGAIVENK